MTLIKSHDRIVKIKGRSYWVYIDEYKTVWSICCKRAGYARCCAYNWRYKKSEFKTIDSVVKQFMEDVKDRL